MNKIDKLIHIRTRIAPSPTGEDLHIGNLYTALINYTFARQNKGEFIIRIEDTDRERFVEGSEKKILATLRLFGILYDEGPDVGGKVGPYRQSERLSKYQEIAEELIKKKRAYYCICTKERLDEIRKKQLAEKKIPRYDKYCFDCQNEVIEKIKEDIPYVIRLNVIPNKKIWFEDIVRGRIEFDSDQVDDQILIKSDGYPTYHLAVVVDDHLMNISHIIRAEEWISSTPKHIILYESLGWELPIFVHVPILRNPDHSKLSKRKNPVWASWYLQNGYLPEAVLNFLALLGWSHPEGIEIFPLSEFTEKFRLEDIKAVGPIFDINKLLWMNGEYIRNESLESLKKRLLAFDQSLSSLPEDLFEQFLKIAQTRMKTLAEFKILVTPFLEKQNVVLTPDEQTTKKELYETLASVSDWSLDNLIRVLKDFAKGHTMNFSQYYKILFDTTSGLPLVDAFVILGKDKTLTLIS